jgi:hypothetical protein
MRWELTADHAITWNVAEDGHLPHEDHVEMSGRRISTIVTYGADADGRLTLAREVIWPMLRTMPGDVRGYLRRHYGDECAPDVLVDGERFSPPPLRRVRFDGTLTFEHRPSASGLALVRTLWPSTNSTAVFEQWTLRNSGSRRIRVEVTGSGTTETDSGVYGEYALETQIIAPGARDVTPGDAVVFSIAFTARKTADAPLAPDLAAELQAREGFLREIGSALRLETPEPALNAAFDFAKIRAAESIFDTAMGLVHSPGGGNYYGGIWANDQAEYSGPFFPFLGYATANEAALNAYRVFARAMTPAYEALPSSFEVEGTVAWSGAGDRGDAAMIAYGASRFALARGDREIAEELWPAIAWCLEFCRRKTSATGIVESDSDELENRFESGSANLSTSTLAYGGLRSAANLGRELGHSEQAGEYDRRADVLRAAIEGYFGANVEGFDTYRYYDGNTVLRSWICLPLTMGILERKAGTIAALFSPRLWTDDGLATESGDKVFWDRSTLYALRGVFAAGETELALRHLIAYSQRRLLGEHVPYPVEAYPENNQQHLSAESALYCRVAIEGIFGVTPTGLRSFTCTPRLPAQWPAMALRGVRAFGRSFDLHVERKGAGLVVTVQAGERTAFRDEGAEGDTFAVVLP